MNFSGLIVVPIYHSKKDEVENSISSGSFKNLLQVIRSLCDQDERLQDEINFVAFGKGKRKSNKIDIVSSSFLEEHNKIILEGFEERLRNSLFDQIIEKSSNNWDLWLLNLKNYLENNKQEYPSKKEDKDLYNWIASQRNRKKNGILKNEEVRKLDSINFVWSIVERKWEKMYSQFLEYAKDNVFPPCQGIDDVELVNWRMYQATCIRENKIISKEQERRFLAIDKSFEGPSSRKKWFEPYNDLVKFRQEYPTKWPQYDRKNNKSIESKLYVFCQTMRSRYRENDLGNFWFGKMAEIGFNFEGKTDNWTEYWQEIKEKLENRNSMPIEEIGGNAYSWILRNQKSYEEGTLSDYQNKKIEELKLDRFFESWEQTFDKIKDWVEKKGKLPTRTTQKDYHSWLGSQRSRNKSNRLTALQIKALQSIGYDLDARGKERFEEKWLAQFNQYKDFLEKHGKDPRYRIEDESEKSLYVWVMAQRAVMAGNASNRKPLSQKRIELLNSINFKWVGEGVRGGESWEERFSEFSTFVKDGHLTLPTLIKGERNQLYTWWMNQKIAYRNNSLPEDKIELLKGLGLSLEMDERQIGQSWDENFEEIKNHLDSSDVLHLPHMIEGTLNPLYSWFRNQKTAHRKGYLTEERIKKFESIGISFDDGIAESQGFTKWLNKLYEIADFINSNGHYPKSGKDKVQSNLYQSLARTKRAYLNNELSKRQLELLNQLKIKLE